MAHLLGRLGLNGAAHAALLVLDAPGFALHTRRGKMRCETSTRPAAPPIPSSNLEHVLEELRLGAALRRRGIIRDAVLRCALRRELAHAPLCARLEVQQRLVAQPLAQRCVTRGADARRLFLEARGGGSTSGALRLEGRAGSLLYGNRPG